VGPESDAAHSDHSLVVTSGDGILPAPRSERVAKRDPVPPPAREVLERVPRRDPEALSSLFDRYFDLVYGLALHLMGERELAEDVTQDVFIKVHRAADRLDPERDPAPWFTAITYNACRDVWRSGAFRMGRRSNPVDEIHERGAELTRGTNDPEDDALAAERRRLVLDALDRLPEVLRVPVVLHDYEGRSHQEIAGLLGIEHAAARKRYSRALTALAEILAPTLGGAESTS
jgi:RNA polymerase sigma-70 factor, ECF subfamily